MPYRNPNSFYDVLPGDYHHLSHTLPASGTTFQSNTGTPMLLYSASTAASLGQTFYPFPAYNGMSPFQYPPSLTGTSSRESSTSLASPPTLPGVPPNYFLSQPQAYLGSEPDLSPPVATTSRSRKRKAGDLNLDPEYTRRQRGPNTKRPGTGHADVMVRSFQPVVGSRDRLRTDRRGVPWDRQDSRCEFERPSNGSIRAVATV